MGWPIHRHATRGAFTVTALSGLLVTALVNPVAADTDRANGYYVEPGQVHAGNPGGAREWLGTYQVQGEPVFCVDYQLKAPETDEEYEPGDELLTKWGGEIPAERAAKISYLLLRYGNTDSNETAGAVAHLLHSWTADPDYDGGTLGKDVAPEKVAYDSEFHSDAMTGKQRDRVDELDDEAAKFRGPWTAEMTAPTDDQEVGIADEWGVTVETGSGTGVPDIPVTVELTGADPDNADDEGSQLGNSSTGEGGDGQHDQAVTAGDDNSGDDNSGDDDSGDDDSATVTTDSDGIATFDATPTDEDVTAHASLRAPAAQPRVQEPVDDSIQTVVSTGGEQELTAEQHVSAKPRPPKSTTTTTTETTKVEVPRTIPAGGQPNTVVQGETTTRVPTGVWTTTGALLLLGAGLAGWVVRKRFGR